MAISPSSPIKINDNIKSICFREEKSRIYQTAAQLITSPNRDSINLDMLQTYLSDSHVKQMINDPPVGEKPLIELAVTSGNVVAYALLKAYNWRDYEQVALRKDNGIIYIPTDEFLKFKADDSALWRTQAKLFKEAKRLSISDKLSFCRRKAERQRRWFNLKNNRENRVEPIMPLPEYPRLCN